MSKITLNDIGSLTQNPTSAQTLINDNFEIIQAAVDNTLSLDGTAPNQMQNNLDMNSKQIINLPAPATANSAARLQDLATIAGGGTVVNIPTGGTTGQGLKKNSNVDYDTGWGNVVSSVGLSLPTDFTVTNSPVTSSGTLTGAWVTPPTGAGAIVRTNSPTIATPVISSPVLSGTATGTYTLGGTPTLTAGSVSSSTLADTNTYTAKDNAFTLEANADTTKKLNLSLSSITTGTNRTQNIQDVNDTFVYRASTDTLTNKTLTAPVIGTITNTGTLTLPTSTDTLVGRATTDTLTNKTIDTANNTFKLNGNTVVTATNIAALFGTPTISVLTSGSGATYTTPGNTRYLIVKMVGGGGGGAGSGTSPGAAGAGGASSFAGGAVTITCNGGAAGVSTSGAYVSGGTATGGDANWSGGVGGPGEAGVNRPGGGGGGSTMFGPGTQPNTVLINNPGNTSPVNSGGGGSGASSGGTGGAGSGGGGGGSAFKLIPNPNATYTYTVGTGGAGGTAGTSGSAGGTGQAGIIIVIAFT